MGLEAIHLSDRCLDRLGFFGRFSSFRGGIGRQDYKGKRNFTAVFILDSNNADIADIWMI